MFSCYVSSNSLFCHLDLQGWFIIWIRHWSVQHVALANLSGPIPFIVSNVGISVHFLVYFPTCFSCSTVHLHIPPAIVYPEIKWYAPHHSECISIARIVCEHTYCPGGKWTCRFSGAPCNCFSWYKLAWQGYVRCSELEVCRCGIKINGMVRIGFVNES